MQESNHFVQTVIIFPDKEMKGIVDMKKIWVLLVMVFILFLASPMLAKTVIQDGGSSNLSWTNAYYVYKGYGSWTMSEGGREAVEGGYFRLSVGVVLGGLLEEYGDVVSVKAEHEETKREFHLTPALCTSWIGDDYQTWGLYLRPDGWMLEGKWNFILTYWDGGELHVQTTDRTMGEVSFPIKPSGVSVATSGGIFTISWSGIGDPTNQPIDYRIYLLDMNFCGQEQLSWHQGHATYRSDLNEVEFIIPGDWPAGHPIQLENRINVNGQQGRATLSTRLPLELE